MAYETVTDAMRILWGESFNPVTFQNAMAARTFPTVTTGNFRDLQLAHIDAVALAAATLCDAFATFSETEVAVHRLLSSTLVSRTRGSLNSTWNASHNEIVHAIWARLVRGGLRPVLDLHGPGRLPEVRSNMNALLGARLTQLQGLVGVAS